jgi:sugar phosphate isomerase/epimerase
MRIGLMNNPRAEPVDEIDFIVSNGFDFIDLTLEYPKSHLDTIDQQAIVARIREAGLGVVGHTTYYLPFASPIHALRQAAINDVTRTLLFFKQAGAEMVTVHPDPGVGAIESKTTVSLNALSFKIISDEAAKHDLTIMVENVPGLFSSVEALRTILSTVPALSFHLDVGHAFVGRNRFQHLISAFKSKIGHIHLSDNKFREDDHLPLGAGNINWPEVVRALKQTGYDGTITLEVFSEDRRYVLASREKLNELWHSS